MVIVSYRDVDIYERDVKLFKPGCWLNDSCISFCFRLIEDEFPCDDVGFVDPAVVSFMLLQATEKEDNEELAASLSVTTKKWIFIPVNDQDSFESASTHWSLLVCGIEQRALMHFDSHHPFNEIAARRTAVRFAELLTSDFRSEYKFLNVSCPQQSNGNDCGVFCVLTAKTICQYFNDLPTATPQLNVCSLDGLCDALRSHVLSNVTDEHITSYRAQCYDAVYAKAAER